MSRPRGFILAELLISIVILAGVIIGFGETMNAIGKINHYQLARQRCLSAAEAQLDSIAATGEAIGDADVQRLWPGMKTTVTREPGEGEWAGLRLVEARASMTALGQPVSVTLKRYVSAGGKP